MPRMICGVKLCGRVTNMDTNTEVAKRVVVKSTEGWSGRLRWRLYEHVLGRGEGTEFGRVSTIEVTGMRRRGQPTPAR